MLLFVTPIALDRPMPSLLLSAPERFNGCTALTAPQRLFQRLGAACRN